MARQKTFKKILKDDLKSQGLDALAKKLKSVTHEHFSMGNALRITVEGATDAERETFKAFIEPYETYCPSGSVKNRDAGKERQAKFVEVRHEPAPTTPAQVGEAPELTAQKEIAFKAIDRVFGKPPKKLQAATGFSLDETQDIVDTFAEPTADVDEDAICERCLQPLHDNELGQEHCAQCNEDVEQAEAEHAAGELCDCVECGQAFNYSSAEHDGEPQEQGLCSAACLKKFGQIGVDEYDAQRANARRQPVNPAAHGLALSMVCEKMQDERDALPVLVSFRNVNNEPVFEVPFAPGLDIVDALKDAAEMARTYNKTAEQAARVCGLFVGRSYIDLIDLAKNGRS